MRKFLFYFFLLISVSAFGQMRRLAEFNFASPSSLNPSVTPATNGITVDVTNKTFVNGLASISFVRGSQFTGAQFTTQTDAEGNPLSYFLSFTKTTNMIIKSENGACIDSVRFSSSHIGDFNLSSGQPGMLHPGQMKKLWIKNNDSNVSSITFENNGDNSNITNIKVYYTEPINVLEPIHVTPQDEVTSFSNLTLAFSSNMSKIGSSNLFITNGDKSNPLSVSINNSNVVLSTEKSIVTDGTYTINIPEGYFQNEEGYRNKALSYTIVVNTPKNILEFINATPKEGEIDKLTNPIILIYGKNLKSFSKELIMYKDGEDYTPVKIERSSENSTEVKVIFDIPQGITEKGIYTINVPEGIIYDSFSKTYNPAFTLVYKVGYTPVPVDSETMKLAKQKLSENGVGYPSTNSSSRVALAELVSTQPTPSDDDLQKALDAYYAETDVEMPSIGNWYYISNVSGIGKTSYVIVNGNKIGMTTKKSEATAFEVVEPMLFKTKEGKYLFTKSIEDNAENKSLTLRKFTVADVDAQKTFGYLSIYGYCETSKNGNKITNAYASVDYTDAVPKVATSDDDDELIFNDKYSFAYTFIETSKPADKPIAIDLKCTLTPSVLTENYGELNIQFDCAESLELDANAQPYLATDEGGKRLVRLTLIADAENKNLFKTSVQDLQNATYLIVLPEGTFNYSANGNLYVNKEMSLKFEVNKKSDENPDQPENPDKPGQHGDNKAFIHDFDTYIYYPNVISIGYEDFNNFSICGVDDDFYVDTTIPVSLKQIDTNRTIRTGYFQKIDEFPGVENCKTGYKLVFDEPIKEGELKQDIYTFVMQPATFGDSSFFRYISGESGVSASQCHVNAISYSPYRNVINTGIDEINIDSAKKNVIYDLMGRRVQSMSRPGIYIVNGKKVVKK